MKYKADTYFSDGCGRCPLGGTPECKVHKWHEELAALRLIVLDSGLTEELKWGVPVYTYNKANVLLIGAFKDNCVLSFLKGVLLKDNKKILSLPGENSQSGRVIRFNNLQDILKLESTLGLYINEAIEVEKAGLKVDFKAKNELVLPEEFEQRMDEFPALRAAFEALTPGRQREYNLFFSGAKQSKTREARIEKCVQLILGGHGLNDDYRAKRK